MKYSADRRHAGGAIINIIIVDRSVLATGALEHLLVGDEREPSGSTPDTSSAAMRAALGALSPDLVLVRVSEGGIGTLELADRIAMAVPDANVIALTESPSPGEQAHRGVPAEDSIHPWADTEGVRTPKQQLLDLTQHEFIPSGEGAGRFEVNPSPLAKLTPREREILALLAEGNSGRQIARHLTLSPNTVRSHIQNIRSKLNVHSRLEAVAFAIRHGIRRSPAD